MRVETLLEHVLNKTINPFLQVTLESLILPGKTKLYHGTDRPKAEWNPSVTPIYRPAWFGLDRRIAVSYASWKRSGSNGDPYVIEYETRKPLKLLNASSPEVSDLMDELYNNLMPDEIANLVLDLGFDGWYIKDSEIMIGDANNLRLISH